MHAMSCLGMVKINYVGGLLGVWGGCVLFPPDKNISLLDLVMPREDYRLAGAAVGLTH